MTNTQLFFAIGLPTFAVLASLTVSLIQLWDIKGDIREIRKSVTDLGDRFSKVEVRLAKVEDRLGIAAKV